VLTQSEHLLGNSDNNFPAGVHGHVISSTRRHWGTTIFSSRHYSRERIGKF
jgi:hypothetical protein